jgi:lysophospholipase L1-like esterase
LALWLCCVLMVGAAAQNPVTAQTAPAQPAAAAAAGPPQPATLEEATALVQRQWTRLQDWAQLGRYREQNAQLAAPAKAEKRVVFMGDSITDGWKLLEYFPGKPYVNRGISGQTTPQMLVRMMPDVVELRPKAVVILAGTNDLAGNTGLMAVAEIERNYQAIAELAKAHEIKVVFASVLPVHDQGTRQQTPRRAPEKIRELNAWLQQYCAENKLVYLDYYSHMLGPDGMLRTDLAADGLHPNAAGYHIMAPLAEQAITKALK